MIKYITGYNSIIYICTDIILFIMKRTLSPNIDLVKQQLSYVYSSSFQVIYICIG